MGGRIRIAAVLVVLASAVDARAQVTSASLRSDYTSPQPANTAIDFTASAVGGREPQEFKWWLWDGTRWSVLRDWEMWPYLTWRPTTAGQYIIAIWARSQGSSVNAAERLAQIPFEITDPRSDLPLFHILFSRQTDPHYVNVEIQWEAWVEGSTEKKWLLWDGVQWTVLREWDPSEILLWTPTAPGEYTIATWVRRIGAVADEPQVLREQRFDVLAIGGIPKASALNFSPDLPSPQVPGTSVTFSAFSTGGRPPYEYKWWLWDGSTWRFQSEWSTDETFTWTPARAGQYKVLAWSRSQGATLDRWEALWQIEYTIDPSGTPAPARSATLIGVPADFTQLLGTTFDFVASASGGVAPYQFKWWLNNGTGWSVLREWSTNASLTWTPTALGTYQIAIWARSNGVTKDASEALAQISRRIVLSADIPAPSVRALSPSLPSPQSVGTAITFTPAIAGGVAPYQFKWWLNNGSGWSLLRDWSTTSSLTWTPTIPGTYSVAVWARSDGVTENLGNALGQVTYVIDSITPVTRATLSSDLASPQFEGSRITFTASATGGRAPAEFKWWLWDGSTWSVLRNWGTATTLAWTPAISGSYRVAIWARSAGVTEDARQALAQVDYRIDPGSGIPPMTSATLTSNVASPQTTNTPITFTAAASGGRGPAEFKWWIWNGGVWSVLREWSTNPTLTWTPTTAGSYMVAIWARSNGATADAREALAQMAYQIAP